MTDALRVSPFAVTHKLSVDLDVSEAADWIGKTYAPLAETIKHRAVMQRYVDGRRWEDTELFTDIYRRRFERGDTVRGCDSLAELARQYYGRVDSMYHDLRQYGFREVIDGEPTTIPALIGPGGTLVIGNQGNHRLAMAKALGLASVLVVVKGELTEVNVEHEAVTFRPELHAGAREIPAMTTPAERLAYYELALAADPSGEVVELGTWLGAATVFLAAGLRDAGCTRRALHAYDRFAWTDLHAYKAGGDIHQPMHSQFKQNLGPLEPLVEVHRGEIANAVWNGKPISLLIADGPKRMRDIVQTLLQFGPSLIEGGVMAWQDFAYFPAYDIPACLDALEQAGQVELIGSVFPGTTAVFRVTAPINPKVIRPLNEWRPHTIISTWERWADRLQPGMRPRWLCGAAMFLCDRNAERMAADLFRSLLKQYRAEIAPKWEYLKEKRASVANKYQALVDVLDSAA